MRFAPRLLAVLCAPALALAGCSGGDDEAASARPRAEAAPATAPNGPVGPPAGWLTGADAKRAPVPILMYHVIGRPRPGTARPDLVTSPRVFARQMAALDRAGYTAVRLDRVLAAWAGRGRLPPRPIVVSFDDGHLGHARYAAPVLRRLGWPGVLNLELDNVGDDGLPSWGVRRLRRDGWEIASHTISHPDLRTLGPRELRRELRTSRRLLRERLGVRTRVLCYPAGKYDARVVRAARAAGYVAATTVREGVARPADPRLELPRVRADGDLAPRVLLRRLRAYGRANARAVPSAIATQRSTHP